jgi:hypothetical protein
MRIGILGGGSQSIFDNVRLEAVASDDGGND